MRLVSRTLAAAAASAAMALAGGGFAAAETFTLVGASQFDEDHAFTKTMRKFEELVQQYYEGPDEVEFELHLNSELGLEKDYFAYMSQGISVDYAVVAPSHMSTFSQMAPLMDMPFLFRDLDHWNKVLDQDGLKPIADDVLEKADVMLIGYAGGGTRNLIVNKPVTTIAEIEQLPIRVMGAPIQTRIFEAIKTAPTVIAYDEVYNAIQTGVIDAAENEAAGIEQMKFYEVGPHIALTQHAITVRPLCFSGKTFERLPDDLQAAIVRAGKEAGAYGREIESSQDSEKLAMMEKNGWLETHEFTERAELLELAEPVKEAYAEELGASEVLKAINAIQ
ncbi:MAG TPA: TRAP transporter substrate-binding protein [Geminicoccaceae bacterium]|jgi:tripartite ATP-independent transporter DctP family solute receptor|nr:TRAP transporter substrate-binding protein [Geminicoccaceae bacterium]